MTLINCVIRILELPETKLYPHQIPYAKFNIELAQARKNSNTPIIKAELCGDVLYDFEKYSNINDYLIIEGYFSVFEYKSNQVLKKKGLIIHIIRLYPFVIKNSNLMI